MERRKVDRERGRRGKVDIDEEEKYIERRKVHTERE